MPKMFKTHRRPAPPGRHDDRGQRWQNSSDGQRIAISIRNSNRWKRFRRRYVLNHPICADPFGRHGERICPTEHVHHIVGLAQDPSLAYDDANLAPLCAGCHHRIESLERSGQPTMDLFRTPRGY